MILVGSYERTGNEVLLSKDVFPTCCNVNIGRASGSDSSADQTCRKRSRDELSPESACGLYSSTSAGQICLHPSRDELSSESESLDVYCSPVELYEKLRKHAEKKGPHLLQRCLRYKIQLKQKKRLRVGNVQYIYRYGNSMSPVEVREDFSCSFCLVKCGSFMGLECHLTSSHDAFNFEFWVSEKCQGVIVSVKYDISANELVSQGADPRHGREFSYFSKCRKRGRLVRATEPSKIIIRENLPIMGLKSPQDAQAGFKDGYVRKEIGVSVEATLIHPADSLHDDNLSPPGLLQFGKTRKLCVRSNPMDQQLLQKHQFFHSHNGQQMAFEEVLSNCDSEDEVDDDLADFEDRRMLDSYVNITKYERHIMCMWNSFVRKQRLLADNHIPWACKAFSQLHGELLVRNPSLLWVLEACYDQTVEPQPARCALHEHLQHNSRLFKRQKLRSQVNVDVTLANFLSSS
ncbi:hypothetical protein ACP4OV_029089 [Aristida adscensionis]